jgi:hypothetical protein
MPTRRALIALAAATTAAVFAMPAVAVGALVEVELVDRSREAPLETFHHRGHAWVAGRPGSRYAVRLTNRSGARVLVVLSVDGVNAVSGETASPGQSGYVLGPRQTAEITGWRKSMTEAAAFYFTALPDSYAARTDRPDNVGVIGVAVFREKAHEPERRPLPRDAAVSEADVLRQRSGAPGLPAAPASPLDKRAAAAAPREERLGTGHGEREYAPAENTAFERATVQPAEVVRLRYDSRENLVASGVIRPRRAPVRPEPFPAFVPDPKG